MELKKLLLNEWFFFVLLAAYIILAVYNPGFLNPGLVEWNTVAIIASLIIINTGIFISGGTELLARRVIAKFKDARNISIVAILLTLVVSMFITNDASLIVLIPITISIGKLSGNSMTRTIIFEALAANVGSTLTPFGNPQNIILFKNYGVGLLGFIEASGPIFVVMLVVLIAFAFLLLKKGTIKPISGNITYKKNLLFLSLLLFIIDIAGLFIGFGYVFFFITALIGIFLLIFFRPHTYGGKEVLFRIDFFLILTFVMIFLVINSVKSVISFAVSGTAFGLLIAALLSQVISNVPTTVLLTGKVSFLPLLWGANIGGNGTIIASLANLIAFRKLKRSDIFEFLKISFAFLAVTLLLGVLMVYL
jgi:Na+/H+ antiporter NhaD/arsenite permease-like protein